MSGHALMTLLAGDGGCDQLLLQCHQPLIGAPSPVQANHPWYPTVILPTTSPAGLADGVAAAPARLARSTATAARAEPASTEAMAVRRVTPMCYLQLGYWLRISSSEIWPAGQPVLAVTVIRQ